MNYIEISQFNNVRSEYKVSGDDLYFVSIANNKQLQKLNLSSLEITPELLEGVDAFRIVDDLILAGQNDCKIMSVYEFKNSRVIQKVENVHVLLSVFIDKCKVLYQNNVEKALYIKDTCLSSDVFVMPGRLDYFSTLSEDILISSSPAPYRRSIIAYNINSRALAWEFNLQEIGKYYSTIDKEWVVGYAINVTIANDRVYVLTYPRLICLDIKTGSLIWQVDVKPDTISKFIYLEATKEILLFDSHQFHFINAISGAVVRSSMSIYEIVKEMGMTTFNSTSPVLDEKYIYITLCYSHTMLIFDKYTFEMVHVINMNTCKDAISPSDTPVIYGNKVLQRSSDGVM